LANSAQAATVQFTDLTSFQANTTGLTNIDFEGIAPAGGSVTTDLQNISGVSIYKNLLNGFGITTSLNQIVDSAAPSPYYYLPYLSPYNWGSGAVLSLDPVARLLVNNLPTGTTAFGIDFMSLANPLYVTNELFTFDVFFDTPGFLTYETFKVNPLNYPNRQFFGVTSTKNISYVMVRPDSGYVSLFDNVTFGTASASAATAVPEPFTVIGTLVGGTAALRMRKKLKAAGK
jgi:hypothetical protein